MLGEWQGFLDLKRDIFLGEITPKGQLHGGTPHHPAKSVIG
jgi:hypothetical protein